MNYYLFIVFIVIILALANINNINLGYRTMRLGSSFVDPNGFASNLLSRLLGGC